MNKEIIVLIGGPGTGKSTIIDRLREKGFCCYPEMARQVTVAAQKEGIAQLFLENPLLFSELLLEGRKKQYQNAINEPDKIIFMDRGIPDVLAYMNYIGDQYPPSFEEACKNYVYTKIFILPPWEEIFVNDQERYENFEQSKKINIHLVETYKKYGYELIEVPKDSLDNRILFILDRI